MNDQLRELLDGLPQDEDSGGDVDFGNAKSMADLLDDFDETGTKIFNEELSDEDLAAEDDRRNKPAERLVEKPAKHQDEGTSKMLRELQDRVNLMERDLTEEKRTAQFLRNQLEQRGRKEEDDADEEEDVGPVTGDALMESIATEGLEGVRKKGIVTKKDLRDFQNKLLAKVEKIADAKVAEGRSALEDDAQMYSDHPEIANTNSPVFKRMAAILSRYQKYGSNIVKDRVANRLAAELAKKELELEGKTAANGARKGEDARLKSISRQSGQTGVEREGGGYPAQPLSRLQRNIALEMGISEKDFAADLSKINSKRGGRW